MNAATFKAQECVKNALGPDVVVEAVWGRHVILTDNGAHEVSRLVPGTFQHTFDYDLARRVYGPEQATKLEGLVRTADMMKTR